MSVKSRPADFFSPNLGSIKAKSSFSKRNRVTLLQGDCLDLLRQVPEKAIQLIVTSPPYNIGKDYERKMEIADYVSQQRQVIDECTRVLNDRGSICWEVGNYVQNGEIIPLDILLYDLFKSNGLKLRNRIVWRFGHGLHCSNRFSGRYETILWFTKTDDYVFNLDAVRVPQKYPGKKHFKGTKTGQYSGNPKGKNPTDTWDLESDVWDIPNVKSNHVEKTEHPCQFPIALVSRLVLALSNEDDIVLDPFMGVGSTAIAGMIKNRKVVGAEVFKRYFDIAIERIRLAQEGRLAIREDKPVYQPPENLSIIKNPFPQQSSLIDEGN